MRASYMSIKHVAACFMAEPNEGAWSMLKRLVRYLAADLRAEVRQGTTRKAITQGFEPMRKSTACAHLFHGVNLLKSRKLDAGYKQFECCRVRVLHRSQRLIDFAGCQKHDD